jgi:hypothetical protein
VYDRSGSRKSLRPADDTPPDAGQALEQLLVPALAEGVLQRAPSTGEYSCARRDAWVRLCLWQRRPRVTRSDGLSP